MQPVLMDWAVGLAFPCQQPMLHANGVTQIPAFRITPDYNAKRKDTDTWEDGRNGGLLGISDLLLRAHVMATYLSQDWGRDWGSLRKFDTIVDAQPATLEFGHRDPQRLWKPAKSASGPSGFGSPRGASPGLAASTPPACQTRCPEPTCAARRRRPEPDPPETPRRRRPATPQRARDTHPGRRPTTRSPITTRAHRAPRHRPAPGQVHHRNSERQ